jgi:hypothetical protein
MYRSPGAGANGPFHHYVFELYALDTKLDVKPSADAFETRANVVKAIQGHILAKAVYGGVPTTAVNRKVQGRIATDIGSQGARGGRTKPSETDLR